MAAQGSILGNAVLRLEDPGLLKGAEQYTDDMPVDGCAHIHFVRSPFAHATIDSIDIADAAGMDGVRRGLHGSGDGDRRLPGVPDVRPGLQPAGPGQGGRSASSATSLRWSSPRAGRLQPMPPRRSSSTTAHSPPSPTSRRRSPTTHPSSSTTTAPTWSSSRPTPPRASTPIPLEGGGHRRRVQDGQPAPRRGPDGTERLPRHPRRRLDGGVDPQPEPDRRARRARRPARPRPREASGRSTRRGRRFRTEGRAVRGVLHHHEGRPDARPPGQVDRGAQREHGGDGAGAGRWSSTPSSASTPTGSSSASTSDVIADCGAYPAIGGVLPHPHPDDDPGCLRHPQDPVPLRERGDEHHAHRRLPGCRSTGGHPDPRAG